MPKPESSREMIYAIKRMPNLRACQCIKIQFGGYEISIAMDDSCGALPNLSRTEIRVYRLSDDVDVTAQFGGPLYGCSGEDLYGLMQDIEVFALHGHKQGEPTLEVAGYRSPEHEARVFDDHAKIAP